MDVHNNEKELRQEAGACETQLAVCAENLAKTQEKLSYITADFENFRRRTEKERLQWMDAAQKNVLLDVLAIVDDFERFYADFKSQTLSADLAARLSGFELIHKALQKLLTKYQIEEITQGAVFDPELHEAIMEVADSGKESGAIVAVLQKGYRHKGAVIRPAKVSVAQ